MPSRSSSQSRRLRRCKPSLRHPDGLRLEIRNRALDATARVIPGLAVSGLEAVLLITPHRAMLVSHDRAGRVPHQLPGGTPVTEELVAYSATSDAATGEGRLSPPVLSQ